MLGQLELKEHYRQSSPLEVARALLAHEKELLQARG
jgi:hypothetical protein